MGAPPGARTGHGMLGDMVSGVRSGLQRVAASLALALIAFMTTGPVLAQSAPASAPAGMVGAPVPWGMGLQQSGGIIKDRIHSFNDLVFWIVVVITLFVMALLGWCMWKYRAEVNPTPSRTSHHTGLEIAWTVIPVVILAAIVVPSLQLIYYQDRTAEPQLTINVQGRQWYWHYQFPDHGNFAFDSRAIPESDLRPGQFRNLEVDEPLVIPVGQNIRIITSGQDVIHSFFVPALGVQRYTIPGRTLETWMRADRVGTFYGQCNQICGTNHWFMPIVVRAVPVEEFEAWQRAARTRFAAAPAPAPALAETAAQDSVQLAEARR